MELFPKFSDLDRLCPLEMILISKIILFMLIVSKSKSSQQCQQTEKKNQTILPKSCDKKYFISLALERFLTDTGVINKQKISPIQSMQHFKN